LADTFEAFIGALYLDQGYDACKNFIEKELIKRKLPEIIEKKLYKDPKSLFQEKSQEILSITPIYQVLEEVGPDHQKNFIVGAFLGEELIAKGEGTSKHEAELKAASEALKAKNW
jgi:ribonuclease-3